MWETVFRNDYYCYCCRRRVGRFGEGGMKKINKSEIADNARNADQSLDTEYPFVSAAVYAERVIVNYFY